MAGRYSRTLSQGADDAARRDLRGRRVRAWAPVVIWVGVVLVLSQGAFSASTTSRFLRPLLLALGLSPEAALTAHFFIRKTAHVLEYATLAFLTARAAILSVRAPAAAAVAAALAVGVAAIDEGNQARETTRTGTSRDVALDASGALLGVAVWSVLRRPVR
jgi:VanZ family protein